MKLHSLSALLAAMGSCVLAGCARPAAVDTRMADAAALRALDEQWSAAAGRGDVAATVAFYAEDAVLLPPNTPIAADRAAIRASWAELLGSGAAVSWKVSKVEVAKSGELGYLYGTYTLSARYPKDAAGVDDRGKLVEVWKKQAGGEWKCVVNTYNSDLPIAAAPKAKSRFWKF